MVKFTLYSYWRSSCSWRVRTTLYLKGFDYELKTVNLFEKSNLEPAFKAINPYGQIPVLAVHQAGKPDLILYQSLAIMEYLEEAFPETRRLLPQDPATRVRVRMISECISSGIQPLQNVSVLYKMDELKGPGTGQEFAKDMITERFGQLETILKETSGRYCVGDQVTMADVCLLPQIYNGHRYGVDMTKFPIISKLEAELGTIPEFSRGHPDNQPDCPGKK